MPPGRIRCFDQLEKALGGRKLDHIHLVPNTLKHSTHTSSVDLTNALDIPQVQESIMLQLNALASPGPDI